MKIVTFKSAGSINESAHTLPLLKALIAGAIGERSDRLHRGDVFQVSEEQRCDGGRVMATDHLGSYVFDPVQHEEPRFSF